MLRQIFFLAQIISAIMLIGLILLQSKGTGLGSTFGEGLSFYGTKRGAERILFIFTIIVAAFFLILSVLGIVLHI